MLQLSLKICQKCILPETFPGISFDENGICNHCIREKKMLEKSAEKKAAFRDRLDNVISEIKGQAPVYDAIVAYSGGKDSSYTLKLLKERYGLRLLSMTFDNHFVSPGAWKNIETVTNTLGVDHIIFRPPWPTMQALFRITAEKDIFPTLALLRASSICTACIGLVKNLVLKTALEMSVPLVAFGWSPGQAPIQSAVLKNNPAMVKQNQSALFKALPPEIKRRIDPYLIPEVYFESYKNRFPYNIHPLAFFEYHEETIGKELAEIGWTAPLDTDTNSTNCRLNAFANQSHLDRQGFHLYVMEIANMIRQGMMDRQEGMEKIYTEQNPELVEYAKKRLDL
jgi:predicted PP-loop superfamily ATPase